MIRNRMSWLNQPRLLLLLSFMLVLLLIVSSCKPAFGKEGTDDTSQTQESIDTTSGDDTNLSETNPVETTAQDPVHESTEKNHEDDGTETELSETDPVSESTTDEGSVQAPPSDEAPVIVLTFDDGPGMSADQPLTETVLDILAEEQVKATFFVLGTQIAIGREDILRRTFDEGHEIGNHGYSHTILTEVNEAAIRQELADTNALIEQVTGQKPTVMRPPTGAYNETVKAVSEELGMSVVNWSWQSTPEDWNHPDEPDFIANHVVEQAGNGHIVLLHDVNKGTIAALPDMIAGLKEKGFRFMTVSEMLSYLGDEHPQPGVIYTHYAQPEN